MYCVAYRVYECCENYKIKYLESGWIYGETIESLINNCIIYTIKKDYTEDLYKEKFPREYSTNNMYKDIFFSEILQTTEHYRPIRSLIPTCDEYKEALQAYKKKNG